MATHKNTKQHTTIATLLLFSIGLLFSSNTFALFTHTIGETYGGGRVFYVYDGGLHGLIAALTDQGTSSGTQWDNGDSKLTGTTGDGVGAGAMNTTIIAATQLDDEAAQIDDAPSGKFAAKLCADYSVTAANGVNYGDWYLPSKTELNLLHEQKYVVGASDYLYWSSTEGDSHYAWGQDFFFCYPVEGNKHDQSFRVRAVRAF